MWLETNPTLEQEPVLISNLIGKRMKTRGARHRKLEVFFFQFALLLLRKPRLLRFPLLTWKTKKKKKAPVSLSEWIFLTPRVRVAHHSFKSLQRTSKKFSNRKDGKFELVSSLSYSVHKYDAYRNCLTVCEPHMHRPHDNSSSSLCGSVVKQWRRSIPRGDNFFVPCSRRGEWTSFSSSFQFFIYLFWISLNS